VLRQEREGPSEGQVRVDVPQDVVGKEGLHPRRRRQSGVVVTRIVGSGLGPGIPLEGGPVHAVEDVVAGSGTTVFAPGSLLLLLFFQQGLVPPVGHLDGFPPEADRGNQLPVVGTDPDVGL